MDNVTRIINALEQDKAYSHPINNIRKIITALSVVVLTGNYVYKFNKPLDYGFLDFTTLENRKDQCEKEFSYNSLISPELYLGVVTINKDESGNIKINGPGEVIEYAVKMKQVNSNAIMSKLLNQNKITSQHIKKVAEKIFQFHKIAKSSPEISEFGKIKTVRFNWDENFEQTEKYKDKIISVETFNFIQRKVKSFLDTNTKLINSRIDKSKIKHCHGDFHTENVFIINDKPIIFDGIVFNQRFPCCDVVSEIAFMAMDLDFYDRQDFSKFFVQTYQELSDDEDLPKLLNFYKCYRSYVRGKIACFTFDDANLSQEEKHEIISKAKKYFSLSKNYAESL